MITLYAVLIGVLILSMFVCVTLSVVLLWTHRQIGDVALLHNRLRSTQDELEGLTEAFRLYKARSAVRATREKALTVQQAPDVDKLIDDIDLVYKQ